MKTNYKEIYKALQNNGIIDNIINKYSKEQNIQLVKADIIYGIELAEDFINGPSFKGMSYWREEPTESKYKIAQQILTEYARIQVAEKTKELECYKYLLKVGER